MELGIGCHSQNRTTRGEPSRFILFPAEASFTRHYPNANRSSHTEWDFYEPRGSEKVCYVGKRCRLDSFSERDGGCAGRNGIPWVSAGDKPYRAVEYSPGFHLLGSTRPPPRFSAGVQPTADTFIPLQPPPGKPRTPYHDRAKDIQRALEITEVRALDEWRPPAKSTPSSTEVTAGPAARSQEIPTGRQDGSNSGCNLALKG